MMTGPSWDEIVIAGKVFAVLAGVDIPDAESLTIDHGVIRLRKRDGTEFEIHIRKLAR
jgi:hypothetical protein